MEHRTLQRMGFEDPEGPVMATDKQEVFWFCVHRDKPWLGLEVHYRISIKRNKRSMDVSTLAVNYGTHRITPVHSFNDLDAFLKKQGR